MSEEMADIATLFDQAHKTAEDYFHHAYYYFAEKLQVPENKVPTELVIAYVQACTQDFNSAALNKIIKEDVCEAIQSLQEAIQSLQLA